MMSPTDRYLILDPEGQPVYSSPDVHAVVLWFWGKPLADSPAALAASPWTVLDYERPVRVRCACVNCLGKRLGDRYFTRDSLCAACGAGLAGKKEKNDDPSYPL